MAVEKDGMGHWLVSAGQESTSMTRISKDLHDQFVKESRANNVRFKQAMAEKD